MTKSVSHATAADATFSAAGVTAWDEAHTLTDIAALSANTFTALQTITQATANAGILASTGYSLTGSDATSMIDLAGTWNTTGTPTAIKLNITNTASNAASRLMDLQVGSASKFRVQPSATTTTLSIFGATANDVSSLTNQGLNWFTNAVGGICNIGDEGSGFAIFHMGSGGRLRWQSTARYDSGSADTHLSRQAAGILQVGTTTNNAAGALSLTNLTAVGGTTLGYVAKTGTYGVAATDYTVDCTSGTFTVTLETATTAGQIHNIKNTGTGIITIATTSAQTIDGGASGSITLAQYDNLTVQSDGANWIIL